MNKLTIFLWVYALAVIPAVHLIAPLFYPTSPHYVSAGDGNSIIGQTNVYAQLLPFVIAYLSAPIAFIVGFVRLRKTRRSRD